MTHCHVNTKGLAHARESAEDCVMIKFGSQGSLPQQLWVNNLEKNEFGLSTGVGLGAPDLEYDFQQIFEEEFPRRHYAFADDVTFVVTGITRRVMETKGCQICKIVRDWALEATMKFPLRKPKELLQKSSQADHW